MSYSQNICFKIFIKVHKSFNVQFSSSIKIFIKVQVFHQSSSFSSEFRFFIKVQKVHKMLVSNIDFKCWFQKMSYSQNIGFKGWFFKMSSFQNNGFLKMFKSISMAWRPGLQILQEGLAKEECSKEHFKKFIIQSSSLSHKMLVSNVDLAKCQSHKILVSRDEFSK